jgi:hypothetical protein
LARVSRCTVWLFVAARTPAGVGLSTLNAIGDAEHLGSATYAA